MAIFNAFDYSIKIRWVGNNCSMCNENETCVPSSGVSGGYECVWGNFYYQENNYSIYLINNSTIN